ncbi:hypothetical protein BP6252_03209 [Coleophoma cylindrospora]|uniref:RNA polymerase I-specific transcription initiation factor RRN6-like protein n=1 Tax=Coleophoma cylindrospora TaxID=1849047 RepID=A0A3D8S714_9HELO|nr:hypothetical protein BP6252_03209 [Coleophoma cylindrospora]
MIDHRVTDLSYGHLGEATYDIETKQWGFSRNLNDAGQLQQLTALTQAVSPSILEVPDTVKRKSHRARDQGKWVTKAFPETWPANTLYSAFAMAPSATQSDLPSTSGALLSAGRAEDIEHSGRGARSIQVVAMPSGEAGEVLRLIRPKVEKYAWVRNGAKLSVPEPSTSDHGFWTSNGGTIQQIVFADDEDGPSSWLAVRQAGVITIFRPIFRRLPLPAALPLGYSKKFAPSRLSCNPVASLTSEKCGSQSLVDVSFNPWYNRQFAVIDSTGSWSIWDIEGRRYKNAALEVSAGKRGQMYDGSLPEQISKLAPDGDGWHRIFWAGGVSTVVVCNRFRVAVFDVKAAPSLLSSPDLVGSNTTDWILDVKRSSIKLSQLFILTSSRVLWVEVKPAGEDKESGEDGARILLSERHFRDTQDETLKLSVVEEEDNASILLVSSAKSSMVSYCRFSIACDGSKRPTSLFGSTTLSNNEVETLMPSINSTATLCVMPAQLTASSNNLTLDPGTQYLEQNVRFYQMWSLSTSLSVSTGLYAMRITTESKEGSLSTTVYPPSLSTGHSKNWGGVRNIVDSFVVADGLVDNGDHRAQGVSQAIGFSWNQNEVDSPPTHQDLRVDMRSVFQKAFVDAVTEPHDEQSAERSAAVHAFTELLLDIENRIKVAKQNDHLPMSTFLELSELLPTFNDLEQTAEQLQDFIDRLDHTEDEPDVTSELKFSDFVAHAGFRLEFSEDLQSRVPKLLQIYDHLVRNWITSLPLKASGQTRLAKYKTVRRIAIELCLSSTTISLRNKATVVPDSIPEPLYNELVLSFRGRSGEPPRTNSPNIMSSQSMATETRSAQSDTASSVSEVMEDPAISRLRQYAVSVKSRPDISSGPAWLSDWPLATGLNPNNFSWEAAQAASNSARINSDDEDNEVTQREAARRRRRTEKFLRRERLNASQTASTQVEHQATGSQPNVVVAPVFSSQVVEDTPMTQPNRGAFGSRPTPHKTPNTPHKTPKKAKKRRAAGF